MKACASGDRGAGTLVLTLAWEWGLGNILLLCAFGMRGLRSFL